MAEQWDLPRKSAPADETIDAALLAELRARVDAGASQLIMLAGPVRRAALALRVAHAMPGPVVMVNATMGSVHAVLRGEPALGRRVLIVAGPLDSAELALRLREIATAAPQVIAVEPDRLWLARMLRALRACRPHLVIVEAGALAAGTLERHARTETVLRWVRDVLPGAGVLALCHPALPAFAQHIGSLLNATPRAVDPLLPRRIALRGRLLSHERDRLPALLDALRTVHGSAFIAVPSRGKAVALTGALARAGFDATAYHGGLTATERAAILGAVRDGRQQLLVATEALATVADLPCPALLAYTHPPRSLEALVVLAERAEPAQRRVPLLMLYTAQDLAAQAEAATRSVPALARLRRIYGALRHQSNRGQVLLDPEQLTPAGAVTVVDGSGQRRLALELLEQAGYLARRADFARAATITLTTDDPQRVQPLATAVPLRRGVPVPIDPVQVAIALGWQPHRLHQWLLEAEDRSLLTLRAIGRELVFTLREPPEDAAQSLTASVERLRRQVQEDTEGVLAVIAASCCRVQALAQALGWKAPAPCGRCDRCAPARAAAPPDVSLIILQALAAVPRGLPRGTALRAARQALAAHGVAAGAVTPGETVDLLLARDLLATRRGELGSVLVVTEAGNRLLAAKAASRA